jgi:hypothetical protein
MTAELAFSIALGTSVPYYSFILSVKISIIKSQKFGLFSVS